MKTLTTLCTSIFCLCAPLAWSQNDLAISDAKYGNFSQSDMGDYTNVEYSVYPMSQVRPLMLNARVTNQGSVVQTGVQLEVEISSSLGYSETVISDPITISPGDTVVIELDPYTPPAEIADYALSFVVLQNEEDDNPLNNSANRTFRISEAEFARDLGTIEDVASNQGTDGFSAGPAYTFTEGAEIHCIGAAISSTSDAGVVFNYELRNGNNGFVFDVLSETEPGTTNPAFFHDINAGKYHWLPLESPFQTFVNSSFVPMFHALSSDDQVFVGTGGGTPPYTNFFSTSTCNDPCISFYIYMVRIGLSEEFCQTAMNPGLDFVTVNGLTYQDENCDGEYNNGESIIAGRTIYKDDNTPIGFSNQLGEFTAYVLTGQENNLYASDLTGFSTNTIQIFEADPVEITGADFGYCVQSELIDFGVSISPVGLPPRPGFTVDYEVCVTNYGSVSTGAEVTFDYTNMLNVSVIDADGGTDDGSSISWSIDELGLFQTHCFSVTMQVAVGTPPGTILNPVASVQPTPPGIDVNVHNDEHSFVHEVVAAYDPNDKTVDYPLVNYTELEPGEGAELEYLIRFQNTGNFFATIVRVEDELPELLDISTIEMIHASHDYELLFHDEHNVEWVFEDIMLPDSTSDEPGSHGHIHFRINTVPDVSLEDVIENSASIFFDFKDPVVTEPAVTAFVDCSEGSLSIETPEVICEGEPFVLTSNRPDFDDYTWNINGQEFFGEEVEYTTFIEEEINAELYATNAVCTLSTEIQMPVIPQPSIVVIPEGYTVCGVGEELGIGAVGSVSWYLNGELVATGNPVVLTETGNYDIVAENECGVAEMNVPVQVVDMPDEVQLTFDGEQLVVEPEGSNYVWFFEGLPVEMSENSTFTPSETGEYWVNVYFENSWCFLTSEVLFVPVSVDEQLAGQISLYPNPAQDVVTIMLPQGQWELILLDASGKQLRTFENVSSSQFEMQLKGIAPGAYFVKVSSEEGSAVKKLIVK